MANLIENKDRIVDTFDDIKSSIENKGITVSGSVANYGDLIRSIVTEEASASDIVINNGQSKSVKAICRITSLTGLSGQSAINKAALIANITDYFAQTENGFVCLQDCDVIAFICVATRSGTTDEDYEFAEMTTTRNGTTYSENCLRITTTYGTGMRSCAKHFRVLKDDIIESYVGYVKTTSTTYSGDIDAVMKLILLESST